MVSLMRDLEMSFWNNYSYLTFHSGFASSASKKLFIRSSGPECVVPIVLPVTVSLMVMPRVL